MKFYHIPKWATYIAMERDGRWYAFEYRPNLHNDEWVHEGRKEEVHPHLMDTLGAVKGTW